MEQVKFLAGEETGRTLAQAAIKFALYQPTIVSVLPNFTNLDELQHYYRSGGRAGPNRQRAGPVGRTVGVQLRPGRGAG